VPHERAPLVTCLDDRFTRLERLHGELERASRPRATAMRSTRSSASSRGGGIDCEFERVDGYSSLPRESRATCWRTELAAARRAGLKAGTLPRVPMTHFDTGPALQVPAPGADASPALPRGARAGGGGRGGRIFTGAHAVAFKGGRDAHVKTAGGTTVAARGGSSSRRTRRSTTG
jgi:hypothetical protein